MRAKILGFIESLAALAGHSIRVLAHRSTAIALSAVVGIGFLTWMAHDIYPPAAKGLLGLFLLLGALDASR